MSHGLFVTFEGLSPTIADSQILVHIAEMRNLGIEIALWAFATKRKVYEQSINRLKCDPEQYAGVKVYRAFPATFPASEILNAIILYYNLKKYGFDVEFIHARTDYSTVVCGLIKKISRFKLIWDCRGDTVAEFLLTCNRPSFIRSFASPLQRTVLALRTRIAEYLCDKAIFVSDALKKARSTKSFSRYTEIIPCVASSSIFYFSEDLRIKIRNQLGIASCQRVVVYSGSLGEYQIFDKCVDLYLKLANVDSSLMLLVLTPYEAQAVKFLEHVPKHMYRLLNVPFSEVNGYLNAADFGLFLRDYSPVNAVASPVKFAEYCLVGLPVIMTDAVEQSTSIARTLGNGIFYDFNVDLPILINLSNFSRSVLAGHAERYLSRKAVSRQYQSVYLG